MISSSTLLPIPDTWTNALTTLEVSLRAAGRRETTVSTGLRHVRQMARALPHTPPAEVTADQLLDWVAARQWEPETRHSYYVSIRSFYTALLGSPGPAQALPTVTRPTPPPHPTPEQVYRTALAAADERVRAILYLAGSAGLRRSEIVQVSHTDLITDPDGGTSLLVHAKGGRGRFIPLTEELTALIRARTRTSSHNLGGWAFPSRAGGHITPRWASKLASRVLPPGWSLHALRHRFATTAYAADRDILAVQRLLGHTSVATTQRYTQPPTTAMRKAVETAA